MNLKRNHLRSTIVTITLSLFFGTLTPSVILSQSGSATATGSLASAPQRRSESDAPRHRARTYDVLHYIIRTSFDVPNSTVIGEVDITLTPLSSGFGAFDLDAVNMKVEQVSLSDGTPLRSQMRTDSLRITLNRVFAPSDTLTVRIRYRTTPKRGLYFISSSGADGFQRPQQIWTQGEPEDNHHWFPCYDFPDDKATSEQFITTGANETAIANGTLVETIENANGTRTFHWKLSQPHSSYLISLVVGDYAKLTDIYENVSLEYYTYRGTESRAIRAFRKTPIMMRWFGDVLGHQFPYARYAQTVVGNFFFGGMENITATTFADIDILGENEAQPDTARLNLVSHELAHSWFGNLVTSRTWAHLWLNEGFASFFEAAFRESQEGRDAYLFELKLDALEYFLQDSASSRHPLVNPNYPLSMALFDATTYKKGAFVVHMLRETVGDELFWKALNLYLTEFKYRTVESKDLQSVFERVSGQSLEWFFDQWVYKAGYPKLRLRANYRESTKQLTISVTQTQKADGLTPAVFRLPIDIEIVTASAARTERIEVNRRAQDFVFKLDEKPQTVVFDKGVRVLKKLIIPQSRVMIGFVLQDGAEYVNHDIAKRAFDWLNFGSLEPLGRVTPNFTSP